MQVFRVTFTRFADDLTGEGARLHKGRWNPAGVPMVYTSSSVALASIECFVNVPPVIVSCSNFSRVDIFIPDDAPIEYVRIEDLSGNWRDIPEPDFLSEIGRDWANKRDSLVLCVPSAALCGHENNFLINPRHPRISDVRVLNVQPFTYDTRMLRH